MGSKHHNRKLVNLVFYTGSICMLIVALLIHIAIVKIYFKCTKKNVISDSKSDVLIQNDPVLKQIDEISN
jgi:hypothetical protein